MFSVSYIGVEKPGGHTTIVEKTFRKHKSGGQEAEVKCDEETGGCDKEQELVGAQEGGACDKELELAPRRQGVGKAGDDQEAGGGDGGLGKRGFLKVGGELIVHPIPIGRRNPNLIGLQALSSFVLVLEYVTYIFIVPNNGVALLMTYPPLTFSTTMHSRLVC